MVCLSHFGKSPAKSLTLEMGLPSPLTPSTWTEPVLHTTAERKKIQTITISQDLLPEPAKEWEEAGGISELWFNFQTEAAAEGQSSGNQV